MGVEHKEIPSLWEAARRETEGYGFLGNYEQPKWDIPTKIEPPRLFWRLFGVSHAAISSRCCVA